MAADVRAPTVPPVGGAVTFRRGAATFGGAVVAAAAGFLLAVVVGRGLGVAGAGVFFSLVSIFTIASTVLKFGMDTAQLWRIPRLLASGRRADLYPNVRSALVPVAIGSVAAGGALVAAAGPVARLLVVDAGPDIRAQVVWVGLGLTAMAPMAVLVAVTRGLGLVRPFILIQNVTLPVGRLVAVTTVLLLGASGATVLAAWALPVFLCLYLAARVSSRELARVVGLRSGAPASNGPDPRARPSTEQRRELWRFAGPRGVTASLETVLIAVNTLIVGVLIGPAAAGVFGALSRFVTTGQLAEQTVRILVAPRFSALLGAGDLEGAGRLYRSTTPWIVLGSWPLFILIAVGSPTLLTVFGDGFAEGAGALTVLALSVALGQLAGNVQTVLLMSGRSGLQLANRIAAVTVLLGLDLVLVPRYGVMGAALAWAAAMMTDTALAVLEVRFIVGLRVAVPSVGRLLAGALSCFGLPTWFAVHRAQAGLTGLMFAVLVGAALYLPLVWASRDHLRLAELPAAPVPPRPGDLHDRPTDRDEARP